MENSDKETQVSLKNIGWKIAFPVLIGIAVVVWLFHNEYSVHSFSDIDFGWHTWLGIALACVFVVGRDFGLTWRFHTIASPTLSWRRALRVDLMCAFTSAITPSAVGGSAFAIFYLNREGVSVGRATTLTLTTLFLDELFFVVCCPLILLVIPFSDLFGGAGDKAFLDGVQTVFWLVYAGIVAYTALLFFGILVKPEAVRRVLIALFSFKYLRRWLPAVESMTGNMISASAWVKQQGAGWWIRVFSATVVSWFSRYFIVNALFWGFSPSTSMMLVFSRQFVVWVLLMVSPTPGGSGVSEWIFTEYYGDLIASGELLVIMALIWRLITYYIYLIAGIIMLPGYFSGKHKHIEK